MTTPEERADIIFDTLKNAWFSEKAIRLWAELVIAQLEEAVQDATKDLEPWLRHKLNCSINKWERCEKYRALPEAPPCDCGLEERMGE